MDGGVTESAFVPGNEVTQTFDFAALDSEAGFMPS